MTGQFGLGDQDQPRCLAMTGEQVIAAPNGFVWKMKARRGLLAMSGSDSEHWTLLVGRADSNYFCDWTGYGYRATNYRSQCWWDDKFIC